MGKRKKLNADVYFTVREDIIHGKYPGGSFITEADLCERFNVSRTPVREALILLANERILKLIPNKGAVVPHITISDIIELCQLRIACDGMAAYLSCERQTPEVLRSMDESVTREERFLQTPGTNPQLISSEDFHFHNLLVKNSKNERLIQTSALIQSEMDRFIYLAADVNAPQTTLPISLEYHKLILDAFREQDSHRARKLTEDHWKAMEKGYIDRSLSGLLPPSL